jgi:hypothetical protein
MKMGIGAVPATPAAGYVTIYPKADNKVYAKDDLGVERELTAGITSVVSLTDAATIATDASLGNEFIVTLGGNRTLGAPTNPTDGQKAIWRFKQDATGGRILTFNAVFRFGLSVPSIVLTTTALKTDYMGAIYNATDSVWDVVAFVDNY